MKHLALDIKNIKDSLIRIQKYIIGKSINDNSANQIKDFKGIGKATWRFISSLYEAHWNSLTADDSNMSFRNKLKSKFNQQTGKLVVNKDKNKNPVNPSCYGMLWTLTFFFFLLSIFLDFIFLFF